MKKTPVLLAGIVEVVALALHALHQAIFQLDDRAQKVVAGGHLEQIEAIGRYPSHVARLCQLHQVTWQPGRHIPGVRPLAPPHHHTPPGWGPIP